MSHVKPATQTLEETVGKVCDLEGDSRLLRDLVAQTALSPTPVLVFGGSRQAQLFFGMGCPGFVFGAQLSQL